VLQCTVPDNFETIERRRYLRLADNFRVQLAPWSGGAPDPDGDVEAVSGAAFSRDLSVGGLCVVSDHAYRRGSVVEATIAIPELDTPLKVVGEVVRCLSSTSGRSEIALRFVPRWIDEDVRDRLMKLIYG